MTREEIREGIPSIIPKHIKRYEDCGARAISIKGSGLYLDAEPFMDEVLSYLHSQGVVIKVDGEPKNPFEHSWMPVEREAYNRALQDLVAVEPLIKE